MTAERRRSSVPGIVIDCLALIEFSSGRPGRSSTGPPTERRTQAPGHGQRQTRYAGGAMHRPVRWTVAWALLVAGVAAAAHHWSEYDNTRGMWLSGVIHSTWFSRPHQLIQLDVQTPEPRSWTVVLASPSKMKSRGLP